MIPDYEKDRFAIADCLKERCPKTARALRAHGATLLTGCYDIWCRDFMPVQVNDKLFVQFMYAPQYLVKSDHYYSDEIQQHMKACGYHDYWDTITPIGFAYPPELRKSGIDVRMVPLVLDGGSVVGNDEIAFVSERVISDNPAWTCEDLRGVLEFELYVDRVEFIPEHPDDFTGHVDGSIRIVSRDSVVIGCPPARHSAQKHDQIAAYYRSLKYTAQLRLIAESCGMKVIDLIDVSFKAPDKPEGNVHGLYANFLQLKQKVMVPSWRLNEEDALAHGTIIELGFGPENVTMIEANEFACPRTPLDAGGALNCVTWNWKS